ncbi:MAG TPA: serine hydrolase domain-containing protein [Thermomicrobiales bacterium]
MARWQSLLTGVIAVLLLLPGFATTAQDGPATDFSAIDRYIEEQIDGSRIPGVALAIVEGDTVVHARGFGRAGDDRDVTPQTPFPVGSLIKSFTALAAMQLVEDGRLDLDAPVQRYLPWFQVADEDASARITVRHLVNQTSGLSRETGIKPLYQGGEPTLEDLVRDLRKEKLNRPVGESYEYSNANFMTLALIVQTVSGEPFDRYLEQHILAPLGMRQSSASAEGAELERTSVYRYWFGQPVAVRDAYRPSEFQGEYLIASADDMARYLAMYLGQGSVEGATILSPAGIEQMLAPATNETTRQLLSTEFTFRYGMGWFVGPFGAAQDARWHLGELPYFNAWMVLLPERNLGVVVLINAGSQLEFFEANEVMSRIPLGVVNILEGAAPHEGRGLTSFYVAFDLIVLAFVAVQLLALLRLVRGPLTLARPATAGQTLSLLRQTAPLVWEVGLGLLLLIGWPAITGMGWRGSWMSFPDLTLVLLVVAGLWLATAIVRVLRLSQAFRERRARQRALAGRAGQRPAWATRV